MAVERRKGMEENRTPNIIYTWMLNLNFLIILYIAGIMTAGTLGYVHENSALVFMHQVSSAAMAPWKIPTAALLLYGSLVLFLCVQTENNSFSYVKTSVEIGVSLILGYLLNFSYSGMLLLILADVIRRTGRIKRRYAAVGHDLRHVSFDGL